jgi:isocitrate dehydrogenase kinase/phosphatase
MHPRTHDEKHIEKARKLLLSGFDSFLSAFATITQRAYQRFERCDWQGMRRDTVERLDLYPKAVNETRSQLERCLGERMRKPDVWAALKSTLADHIRPRCDAELACTFFNSVYRRIAQPSGVDIQLTFIEPCDPTAASMQGMPRTFRTTVRRIHRTTVKNLLMRYRFGSDFINLEDDADRSAGIIAGQLGLERLPQQTPIHIEMLAMPFFRGMSAYLIGRIRFNGTQHPLVFAIDNSAGGMQVDAVLLTTSQVRILFSFSRAYFHVQTDCPSALVNFLKQLMPNKRSAELYIGLGFHKHGKTELYSDLLVHQQVCSEERFDFSPGQRGMVMIAFNMPGDDLIYKVIRDRFDSPKQTTAGRVKAKYEYVFKHDRVGRLVDVQTFEHLELEDCCFTPDLLAEIAEHATQSARIENGRVTLYHTYVERRVTPLDLFLKTADPAAAGDVVIDFGRAIKDLARVNVFPGDMLIKNFGVTNLGRVVFYDYDELCPLLQCNFRRLPQARQYEDELSAEPWFMVGEHDVFPEEFASFLGLPPDLRKVFFSYHGDLLDPDFWKQIQSQIRAGLWTHIRPYGTSQRLRPRPERQRKG